MFLSIAFGQLVSPFCPAADDFGNCQSFYGFEELLVVMSDSATDDCCFHRLKIQIIGMFSK